MDINSKLKDIKLALHSKHPYDFMDFKIGEKAERKSNLI